MKILLALVLVLTTKTYTFSQAIQQTAPASKQQENSAQSAAPVKTNQPAKFDLREKPITPQSRDEEPVVENKPVKMGEALVNIKELQNRKKKEDEPVQNIPVRKEERAKAVRK
jgi:hypothetical protein